MKLRLSILLLAAAALASSPAAGQTVKSLGYNTTNGNIVAATNVTFTNSVGFATNARATTRTNLGLGGSDSVTFSNLSLSGNGSLAIGGMNVTAITSGIDLAFKRAGSTELELKTNGLILHVGSYAFSGGNSNGASTTRTNLGLGGTDIVTFSNIQLNSFPSGGSTGFVGRNGGQLSLYGTNVSTSVPAFYGYDGFNNTAFSAGTARTNLELGATNNVTFSNVTASGTLTATGNVTMSGVNNTMPGATNAASGASLMTRDLVDNRSLNYAINSFPHLRFSSITAAGGTVLDTPWNTGAYTAATTNAIAHGRLMFPIDSMQFGTVTSPNKFWLFTRVSLFCNTNNGLDTVTFGDAGGTNTVQYPLEDGTSTNPAYVSYGTNFVNDDNRFAIQLRHNSTNIQARLISMRPGSPSGVYSETAWTNVAVSPVLSTLAERPLLIALQRNNTNVIAYAAQATGIAQAYIDANSLQVIGSATIESGGYNPTLGFRAVSKSGNLMRIEFMNTQAVVTP
jgi:hypothetical protein